MSDLRREIRWHPGFDKRADPDPKERQYGCHSMVLTFYLHGDHGTVQFKIYTGWLPGQERMARPLLAPMAADLGYHWDSPRYEEQSWLACDLRSGGKCYYDGSGLAAEDLFSRFLAEGEAVVWATLEERYRELDGRVLPSEPAAGLA